MTQRRVVIVGASARTGRAIAAHLAGPTCTLVLGYFSGRTVTEACAREVDGLGGSSQLLEIDLTCEDSIARFAEDLGPAPIDLLVFSSGAYEESPIEATDLALFVEQFKANAAGPALLTSKLKPQLAASSMPDGAAVVLFGDIHADLVPRGGAAAYLTSKAATHALVRLLAVELAPTRVIGIAPGVIAWPEDVTEADREAYLRRVPLSRVGTPSDAARLVRALVFDSGYVTGVIIPLDGGRHLR